MTSNAFRNPAGNITTYNGGSESCQIPLENGLSRCGETETLQIIQEFQKLYEEKLKRIGSDTANDSLEAKVQLQQDWIRDLTEQNTMLVQVVSELEQEATERVTMLEEKLRATATCGLAAMKQIRDSEPQGEFYNNDLIIRLNHLQQDVSNLLEYIRRAREEGRWSADGLHFFEVPSQDLLGTTEINSQTGNEMMTKLQEELAHKEGQIETLHDKIHQMSQNRESENLRDELKKLRDSYSDLHKSKTDIREALTAEVADKHDFILEQKRDIQALEEQCRQADKQTHFKDDIIKELRKEIKNLSTKGQVTGSSCSACELLQERIKNLEEENSRVNQLLKSSSAELTTIEENAQYNIDESNELQDKLIDLENKLKEAGTANERERKISFDMSSRLLEKHNSEPHFQELERCHRQIQELQTALASANNNDQLIKNKEEVIRIQNDTLNISEIELQALRQKIAEIENDKSKCAIEISKLMDTCNQQQRSLENVEAALQEAHDRADNLQAAVDLYINSVTLLEESKQKAEQEINQQKITINNLQEALVSAKMQNDELQNRGANDFQEHFAIINSLYNNLLAAERKTLDFQKEIIYWSKMCEHLRDANLEMQVVNYTILQDLHIADERINKYQLVIKNENEEMEKVCKREEYYESIVRYMKSEMKILSEQLQGLQQLLKLANSSYVEENSSLRIAVQTFQHENNCLVHQINEMQIKLCREKRINTVSCSRIEELQKIIATKTVDLNRYNEICQKVMIKLDTVTSQNKELQSLANNFKKVITKYEQTHQINAKQMLHCQQQIDCFRLNVCNLTQKTNYLREELNQKVQELNKSQTSNQKLSAKLEESKIFITRLQDDHKICQDELAEAARKSKRDFIKRENDLKEKLQVSKEIEARCDCLINKFEEEIVTQEELLRTKKELNRMIQTHDEMKIQNDKLTEQLQIIKENKDSLKCQNAMLASQLDQRDADLESVRASKAILEMKVPELERQSSALQIVCSNLNTQIKAKSEFIAALESELQDTRSARDEISAESRSVLTIVRSWLEEQKVINDDLSDSFKKKKNSIAAERDKLMAKVHDLQRQLKRFKEIRNQYKISRHQRPRLNSTGSGVSSITKTRSSMDETSSSPSPVSPSNVISNQSEYLHNCLSTDEMFPLDIGVRKVRRLTKSTKDTNKRWKLFNKESECTVSRDE